MSIRTASRQERRALLLPRLAFLHEPGLPRRRDETVEDLLPAAVHRLPEQHLEDRDRRLWTTLHEELVVRRGERAGKDLLRGLAERGTGALVLLAPCEEPVVVGHDLVERGEQLLPD